MILGLLLWVLGRSHYRYLIIFVAFLRSFSAQYMLFEIEDLLHMKLYMHECMYSDMVSMKIFFFLKKHTLQQKAFSVLVLY